MQWIRLTSQSQGEWDKLEESRQHTHTFLGGIEQRLRMRHTKGIDKFKLDLDCSLINSCDLSMKSFKNILKNIKTIKLYNILFVAPMPLQGIYSMVPMPIVHNKIQLYLYKGTNSKAHIQRSQFKGAYLQFYSKEPIPITHPIVQIIWYLCSCTCSKVAIYRLYSKVPMQRYLFAVPI